MRIAITGIDREARTIMSRYLPMVISQQCHGLVRVSPFSSVQVLVKAESGTRVAFIVTMPSYDEVWGLRVV